MERTQPDPVGPVHREPDPLALGQSLETHLRLEPLEFPLRDAGHRLNRPHQGRDRSRSPMIFPPNTVDAGRSASAAVGS